ncbi:MerR family transcriptional regulator [Nesterenkonia muleiensis]|uniref:MerR family transcriptional regulator n=1 Tax=Nesterenkonia muleiensis TaxID=2282648 RepID=UPI001EE4BE26|nr:helix-turn-helix domain-containing protein [Nesterenkonia muleiensis]
MLTIGAFAQIGQVTHRMLRHWDAAGLLVPAHTDPFTGYRSYDPSQLDRLHRIMALRQLGFGIEDIASLLADGVNTHQLTRMLGRRRTEVQQEHRIAEARLADVERRLHLIEKEKNMSTIEIVTKSLPAVRLAARTATVKEQPQIAGVVGPAFDGIAAIIGDFCGALETPIAAYSMVEDGTEVTAGYEYSGQPREGFEIVTLPAEDEAFVTVHLGSMSTIH